MLRQVKRYRFDDYPGAGRWGYPGAGHLVTPALSADLSNLISCSLSK